MVALALDFTLIWCFPPQFLHQKLIWGNSTSTSEYPCSGMATGTRSSNKITSQQAVEQKHSRLHWSISLKYLSSTSTLMILSVPRNLSEQYRK